MKASAPAAAEVSWAQVHAYRLSRHNLIEPAPKKDLVRVVGDISGVQAQVMSAAELQACVRVECSTTDVRDALWKKRTLVKTWLMRGTLHLVPSADLPIYTAAMSARWMRATKAWLKFFQLSEPELCGLVDAIGEVLDGNAMTREQLIDRVAKGRPSRIQDALRSGWGGILKPVARKGLLCFGPSVGQSVTFVRPQEWLPSWRRLDPDEALSEMARRYLRAYGPATRDDFARWWGNWQSVGKAAWAGLGGELVTISVEGRRVDTLASEARHLAALPATSSVQLLPAFDPYVMGHSSRDHLFDAKYSSRVSRTAGWISPVVLVDGRVVATWTHQVVKGKLQVTVEPFGKLSPKVLSVVRDRAATIARVLGLAEAAVKVVSS